ncbi:MAG: nucleotidyltransferase family protein [Bacteroidales bacterium]|nr:nucleotidyltransferase family protein [Bacteroidales bacterium]
MEAMIFAAGLGTRLSPLTDTKPKALVNFKGKTMLENAIEKIISAGFDRIIINVHHFSNMMKDFISNLKYDAEILISDESDCLLDTGGGILKAKNLLIKENNFLLYNVDIACNIDLKKLYNFHLNSDNIATLAIKYRNTSRKFIFDNNLQLCGWKNFNTNETKISKNFQEFNAKYLAFSGISVINSRIFDKITETGKFSITPLFLRLAKSEKIAGYIHSDCWADLGTIERLNEAEILF